MKTLTLEREFAQYAALHKYSVLFAVLKDIFRTLEQGQVNIPDFMRDDTPEKLAKKEIRRILCTPGGMKEFNYWYERAWRVIAPLMD